MKFGLGLAEDCGFERAFWLGIDWGKKGSVVDLEDLGAGCDS